MRSLPPKPQEVVLCLSGIGNGQNYHLSSLLLTTIAEQGNYLKMLPSFDLSDPLAFSYMTYPPKYRYALVRHFVSSGSLGTWYFSPLFDKNTYPSSGSGEVSV